MKILALELSAPEGSVAWLDTVSGQRADANFPSNRKNSGAFFEQLRTFLERWGNPQRIGVGLGPGSYAGTRIALAAASGLAAASDAQLCGLPSVCAMATTADEYAVIGDARRQSFYWARVRGRQCLEEPRLLEESVLREIMRNAGCPVLTTEQLDVFPEATVTQPSARILAEIAADSLAPFAAEPLEPIYLRPPHITQPKSAA